MNREDLKHPIAQGAFTELRKLIENEALTITSFGSFESARDMIQKCEQVMSYPDFAWEIFNLLPHEGAGLSLRGPNVDGEWILSLTIIGAEAIKVTIDINDSLGEIVTILEPHHALTGQSAEICAEALARHIRALSKAAAHIRLVDYNRSRTQDQNELDEGIQAALGAL